MYHLGVHSDLPLSGIVDFLFIKMAIQIGLFNSLCSLYGVTYTAERWGSQEVDPRSPSDESRF